VALHLKTMLSRDRVPQFQQIVILKLAQSLAFCAVKMIVLRIPIIVLVDAATIKLKLSQQSRIHELGQSPINGRAADVSKFTFFRQLTE
jgi:hypothetical protein